MEFIAVNLISTAELINICAKVTDITVKRRILVSILNNLANNSNEDAITENQKIIIHQVLDEILSVSQNNPVICNQQLLQNQTHNQQQQQQELDQIGSGIEENSGKLNRPSVIVENPQRKRKIDNKTCYKIINYYNRYIKKFNCSAKTYIIKINLNEEEEDMAKSFEDVIAKFLFEILADTQPHDRIGVTISIPSNPGMDPVGVNFTPRNEFNANLIIDLLNTVGQSNSHFLITDLIQFSFTIVHMPYGSGYRVTITNLTSASILQHKTKSILHLTDAIGSPNCLPTALVLGQLCIEGKINNILNLKQHKIEKRVSKLCKRANVVIDLKNGCSIQDVLKFQNIVPYNIVIYNNKKDSSSTLFRETRYSKDLNIFYFEDIKHFVFIKKLKSFFGRSYQCNVCKQLFNKTEHNCILQCKYCFNTPICKSVIQMVYCSNCNRKFRGENCYNNHLLPTSQDSKTICQQIKICFECCKYIDFGKRQSDTHECGEYYCKLCKTIVPSEHKCYIPNFTKPTPKRFSIIFFDLECSQDKQINTTDFLHEPMLCVANQICHKCYNDLDYKQKCKNCGEREQVFENDEDRTCISKFIDFLEKPRTYTSTVWCIAHNFKGYDGHFLLDELLKRDSNIKPLLNGCKILKLQYKNYINFIDSLSFLQFPLSKFPEAFGLENLSKGYYPHLFNTKLNWNYIGEIPPISMFNPENMTTNEISEFKNWHKSLKESNFVFNNKLEMVKYCKQDVRILRQGCIKFMNDFLQITNINPFTESMTIAQAVMLAFRKNYLIPNTIAHMSLNNRNSNSHIGLKWLEYIKKKTLNTNLIFEHKISTTNFIVDGFDPQSNTIYEFLGCYFHGCLKCFKHRNLLINGKTETIESRYFSTFERIEKLKSIGYSVVFEWECDFLNLIKSDSKLNAELEDAIKYSKSLNLRDAIFGGRTETFQLHSKIDNNQEMIEYLDFTSLYPYINKYGIYPIGHPTIYKGSDNCKNVNINSIEGFIKCLILPPSDLLIPVLPAKINNKLLFTLCRCCAEENNVLKNCTHNIDSKALFGTWPICEIKLALEKNYQIIKYYEIWAYDFQQYDQATKSGGLFTDFLNNFLKIKQEASGWPKHCLTDQDRQTFISEYYNREGIKLNAKNIKKNSSMRNTAKLAANSFWGKFIQRTNLTKTKISLPLGQAP